MKLDVVEKKENPFLKRTDLILTVDHKGQATPKTEDLEKSIAEQFKSVPEKVEIVYIFSEAGLAKAKIKARVWKEKIIGKKKKEAPKEEEIKPPKETEVEEKKEELAEKKAEEQKPEQKQEEKLKEKQKEESSKPEKKEGEKK